MYSAKYVESNLISLFNILEIAFSNSKESSSGIKTPTLLLTMSGIPPWFVATTGVVLQED